MNKTVCLIVALVVLVTLMSALPALSQPGGPGGAPRGGPGMGGPMQPPPPPLPPVFELIIAASVLLIAAEGLVIAYVAWSILGLVKAKQSATPPTVANVAPTPATPPVPEAK